MRRPRARVLGPLAAALTLCTAVGSVVAVGPAAADPLADARARAAALAATVDRLQTQAEIATEKYNGVETALGVAVTTQELADRRLEAAEGEFQRASEQVAARVRALYESGGRATLLATVLGGSDPADAVARMHMVGNLLSFDSADASAALAVTEDARRLSAERDRAAREVIRLQQAAATAAAEVTGLLHEQQVALRAAGQEVRRLAEQRRRELAAESAAAFSAALVQAGGTMSPGTVPTNEVAAGAIAAARSRLGDPYVWGATGPDTFDCSGLTQWSYARVGVQLPRVAADQWNAGRHVSLEELEPGDLLFWANDLNNPATIHHVAMYLGAGMMIAAPHTGDVVKVQPVYLTGYIGATRPFH
jgi:cell wall-associated NlpC family hydrolase